MCVSKLMRIQMSDLSIMLQCWLSSELILLSQKHKIVRQRDLFLYMTLSLKEIDDHSLAIIMALG